MASATVGIPPVEPRGEDATASTSSPATVTSNATDAKIDQLFSMMGVVFDKINSMDGHGNHEVSDSDNDPDREAEPNHVNDPLDSLSMIVSGNSHSDSQAPADITFDKALADFAGFFSHRGGERWCTSNECRWQIVGQPFIQDEHVAL